LSVNGGPLALRFGLALHSLLDLFRVRGIIYVYSFGCGLLLLLFLNLSLALFGEPLLEGHDIVAILTEGVAEVLHADWLLDLLLDHLGHNLFFLC
jgi:hypothetical protein